MGGRPHSGNQAQLRACDQQLRLVSDSPVSPPHSHRSPFASPFHFFYSNPTLLSSLPPFFSPRPSFTFHRFRIPLTTHRQELAAITDEVVYTELQTSDMTMGRWTAEDPSLRAVQRWVRTRRC
jgi:hypothetical protein